MNRTTLDKIDIKILNELQNNAALTNVELAARVNLSPSPCLVRVKALERVGIIDRRVTLLNPSAVGLSVNAFIHVKLERHIPSVLDKFRSAVDRISEIMECYLMTGDCDYILRAVVHDIDDLENLIVNKLFRLEGVTSIRSNIVLKQIRHKTALPIDSSQTVYIKADTQALRRVERKLAAAE